MWTEEKILEFPGSANGPWARYIVLNSAFGTRLSTLGIVRYPRLEPKDAECAKKLKDRTLTKLHNERPTWLDLAHKKLDTAVAAAYGWPADLLDEQILERLLKLNLDRTASAAPKAVPRWGKQSTAPKIYESRHRNLVCRAPLRGQMQEVAYSTARDSHTLATEAPPLNFESSLVIVACAGDRTR